MRKISGNTNMKWNAAQAAKIQHMDAFGHIGGGLVALKSWILPYQK
jgi:hypothetical protein